MPTDLVGVGFYLLLILPGVVFAMSRERHRPRVKRSAFRETATAIFVSTAIVSLFALLFAVGSVASADVHREVQRFLLDPATYARQHFEPFVIFGLLCLALAAWAAWWLGGPTAQRLVFGRSDDPDRESWGYVFNRKPEARNFAGVQLTDGTWVQGFVDTYGNVGEEGMPKALTLIGQISIRPAGGELEAFDGEVLVVKDSDILYLTVTYLENESATSAPGARPTKGRRLLRIAAFVAIGVAGYQIGTWNAQH